MAPSTDYIRHAAKLTRQMAMDASMGTPPVLTPDYLKALAKALEQVVEGLEQNAKRKD